MATASINYHHKSNTRMKGSTAEISVHEEPIPEESIALLKDRNSVFNLTGEDEGFGTMADALTPSPVPPAYGPRPATTTTGVSRNRHKREFSAATEISWLSNVSSFLRRGYSRGDSMSSDRKKKRTKTQRSRLDNVWRILFDKQDAVFTNLFLGMCYTLVILYSILIFVGPFILSFIVDKEDWCYNRLTDEQRNMFNPAYMLTTAPPMDDNSERMLGSGDFAASAEQPYPNPDYNTDPCRYVRFPFLSFITLEECDICRRLLTAVFLGGAIGYERRSADRPAGIRTMGLVSLGACFFTISSIMAFKSSTQTWDSSRVTAALPSGVGFLGGALIWKGSVFVGDQEMHQVHGLTTAASLWLSAAVGVGVGGALYLVTVYVTTLVIMILRYGPRIYLDKKLEEGIDEDEEEEEDEEDDDDQFNQAKGVDNNADTADTTVTSAVNAQSTRLGREEERKAKLFAAKLRKSMRDIPTFGS